MKNTIIYSLCAAALLAGCETTIPGSDSEFPRVRITAPQQSNQIIGSTDRNEHPSTDITCGVVTEIGMNVVILPRGLPTRLMLTVSDSGGVAKARAVVVGGRISNIDPADAVIGSEAGSLGEMKVVEKFYDRSDPRTAQVILFDVEPTTGTVRGPDTIWVWGVGDDFNENRSFTLRQAVGTQEALCDYFFRG